jgi:carboxyl-terminal processing protease
MNTRFKYVIVSLSTLLVGLLLFGAVHSSAATTSNDQPYRHLAVFSEVLQYIKSSYVEEPNLKGVTAGALNGLLESVDPFASYLSADLYKQYEKEKGTKKADIGLVLARRVGYVSIVVAVPGGPASKSNLSTGDVVEAINGVGTRDMPLAFAQLQLQGEPGTTVELTILRIRNPEPQKLTITRAEIKYPDVTAKMLESGYAQIHVSALDAAHVKQLSAKIQELEKQGTKKLIVDFRNCSIGSPEDGVAAANLFLYKGLITYLSGQKMPRQDFQADPAKQISKLPLVVITNRGTSGAAELAAAALVDNKRADSVGERTYGNSAVRRPITLDDGSAIILAVAKYYAPDGKAIQDGGFTPGNPVSDFDTQQDSIDDDSDGAAPVPQAAVPAKPSEDAPLKKAIELLNK